MERGWAQQLAPQQPPCSVPRSLCPPCELFLLPCSPWEVTELQRPVRPELPSGFRQGSEGPSWACEGDGGGHPSQDHPSLKMRKEDPLKFR